MKPVVCCMAVLALAGASAPALADSDWDGGSHGRYERSYRAYKSVDYKEEYWDGNCKIVRKWKKNGKYKEERKCEGPRHYGGYPPPVYPAPGVMVQPPSVVIQAPPIVIR